MQTFILSRLKHLRLLGGFVSAKRCKRGTRSRAPVKAASRWCRAEQHGGPEAGEWWLHVPACRAEQRAPPAGLHLPARVAAGAVATGRGLSPVQTRKLLWRTELPERCCSPSAPAVTLPRDSPATPRFGPAPVRVQLTKGYRDSSVSSPSSAPAASHRCPAAPPPFQPSLKQRTVLLRPRHRCCPWSASPRRTTVPLGQRAPTPAGHQGTVLRDCRPSETREALPSAPSGSAGSAEAAEVCPSCWKRHAESWIERAGLDKET